MADVTLPQQKKIKIFCSALDFFSVTLQEIAVFLYIKAVWGIEEKLGYELETVLNSTFCYKLHPLELCSLATNGTQERTPDAEPATIYGSSSVAKVINLSARTKSIHTFFFRACSLFLQSLWHLMWHLPERCVLGYVLLPNICDVSHTLGTLT